ncbi:UBLCP1 [Cordylochernes scorpioides]|uniref:Ubiquitin-like domain-containing CTD phosphatase 1 n=1 Tax=Cordylochernes scorpioides TaxID=51811 RepID=A0ABY6K197_9ARAC|nr:UBLCP1 [Cordylochernes scorpioides]
MSLISIVVKWNGNEYPIEDLYDNDSVADLKAEIQKKTGVLPARQKLLGLKYKGKAITEDIQLSELNLRPKMKIMMVGSLEDDIVNATTVPTNLPVVADDFDIEEEDVAVERSEIFLAKIQKRISSYEIKIFNEPRPGKKLLVLDIDYTLFDHRSTAQTAAELMRPYLHEFLTTAYEDYDIVIWSATSMKWINAKMNELGVASNPNYKIAFYLDVGAMISVHTPKYGLIEVKPLGVIWGKFDQYSAKNTIMIDDLRRNFLMNPQSGLKIRPFKDAHQNRTTDTELLKLSQYLKKIAKMDDFSTLNHKKAERKLKLFINNSQITHSEHPKYLGIHLDRTLTFKTHLTKLKGKLSSRNNILHKLAGSSWGSDANTLRTSALALIFSTAEYCAPVWEGSCHTKLIDTQLNSTLRIITGVCQPTRIDWLPVLAHISPPELRRKEATKKMYQKLLDSPDLEINPILQSPPKHRLKSRNPIWSRGNQLLSQNFNISEAWTNSWISSDIPNKNLITSPSVKIPGFSLPRREWVLLNRFRTGQGRCAELMKLWGYTKDPNCACNVPQSMSHILDDCPLYKFNGGISNLHSVTPEALNWLKALPLRL